MGNENGKTKIEKSRRVGTKRVEWLWNASPSGFSYNGEDEWERYCEIEIQMIEDGFQKHQESVELDQYIIDLRHRIQINKKDHEKQRQIKRVSVDKESQCLRERFSIHYKPVDFPLGACLPSTDHSDYQPKKSFSESESSFPPFVDNWLKEYPNLSLPDTVEQAASGILIEGENLGALYKATWIAQYLREYKFKEMDEICEGCLRLYTMESFLYKLLNKTLREDDMTKINTLGAFCYLLFYCPATKPLIPYHYKGLVYRGLDLTSSDIADYQNAIGKGYKCWLGFSSTSKSRAKAKGFGNTLFIIAIKYAIDSLDISSYSNFPDEEEVLLSASQVFKVDDVTYNANTKQHEIHITIWWTIA